MKLKIFVALAWVMSPLLANEPAINILKPYTAICKDSSAILYRTVDGRWVNEHMPGVSTYELRKLDYSANNSNKSDRAASDLASCTGMRITELASHVHFIEHCYSVKEIPFQGEASERSEMCSEYYFEGEIVSVDCRIVSFQPNGTFQSKQWIMDMKGGPDAILQSSGNCRVLAQ